MYKEKLLSQMEFLEKLQSQCSTIDVTEAIELGRQILALAKKIDEYENLQSSNDIKVITKPT